MPEPAEPPPSLPALFARFLKFGLLAWGGPIAQIAMVRRELVDEARWLSPSRFARLLAVYQVLPGPEAHELCVHLGMMKHGRLGGIFAGLGFMLPGLVLILLLAWLYQRLDLAAPPWAAIFLGIQVGVIALIARAVHTLGQHLLTDRWLWLVAALSFAAALADAHFWIVLPAGGLLYLLLDLRRFLLAGAVLVLAFLLGWWMLPAEAAASTVAITSAAGTLALFLSGLKAGLLTFGGAYTAIPFVRDDTVGRGWLSDAQFLDGLALSGILPAPLIIFATFVGYQVGGLAGALAITAGIFLPAFAFSLLFFDRLESVIENDRLHQLLTGVAAGVVGLVAATTVDLATGLAAKLPALLSGAIIAAAALALLYGWRSKLSVPAAIGLSAIGGVILF